MAAVLALMLAACSKYDDTELRNKVNSYESRIAALESLSSYKDLLQELGSGATVTSYAQNGNEITLTFNDGKSLTFNIQGPAGESIKGEPGTPGKDGKTPQFKIEGETWKVSYDDGATWTDAGSAVDRSLIQNISTDGSTLTITLAGGTVIPVPYGDKEAFGLEFGGGRKYYSFMESLDTYYSGRYEIPYTLTGDIAETDDVQLMVSVQSRGPYSRFTIG